MGLDAVFIPEKLIEARHAIVKVHSTPDAAGYSDISEETLELMQRINDTQPSMLRATALALSDKEVMKLAGSVPYCNYDLNGTNLAAVLKQRLDENTSRILFENWQEEFNNPGCNDLLKDLAAYDGNFIRFLSSVHIDGDVFIKVLDSVNIPLSFDEELVGCRFRDGEDFNNRLKFHGIVENSFLDIECKRALLAFCSRADYLECSQKNILYIIEGYDDYMLKRFLINFMDKMSLSELQIYPEVAEYLRSLLGQRKSETFISFFEGADKEYVQKYIDWINIYKINTYFGEDERSRFWKQYRYVNVIKYPVSNIVILEFDHFLAVEFLGGKKGTIYICEKEAFRQTFYNELDRMTNDDLRIFFKVHKDQCIESRNHIGRWQTHIDNVIARRQITDKIEI